MKFNKQIYPWILMMLLVVSAQVQAAPLDDVGLMDNILNRYSNVAGSWATVIQDYAIWMFWSLTIISMVWTFGLMAMQERDFFYSCGNC